jgi:hypothetical protein
MLALPSYGMARSVTTHNVNVDSLCDWIEASIVFDRDLLSKADVVEALLEHEVYARPDFAVEIVDQAWAVVSGRIKYLSDPLGLKVSTNRITRVKEWDTFPAYGFCLALACSALFPRWAREQWAMPPSVHGELFEEVARESFTCALAGWTVRRVGWSPSNPPKLRTTIAEIISDLNEVAGSELELHVDPRANELGLDLLAYFSYGDSHASFPVLLVQCASGNNWLSKRQTPDIELWKTIVSFNSQPVRAFAMPFTFADASEFRRHSKSVNGVFVDRNRLLAAFARSSRNVSESLNLRLVEWTRPVVASMPRDNQ